MAFQSNLRPASFRGISFDVSRTILKVGRRVQVFEYPQRDMPFVEDLGRSARTVTVTAITSGSDYIGRMKRIISACEKAGSGRYVDPWLGTMTVTPKTMSSPIFDSIRIATITLEFVESGEYRFPNSLIDTGSLCKAAAEKLNASALGAFFKDFDLDGVTDFAKKTVGNNLSGLLSEENLKSICGAFGVADGLADVASDTLTLIDGGARVLGGRLMDTLTLAGVGSTVAAWSNVARRVSRLVRGDKLNLYSDTSVGSSGASASKIRKATVATLSLVRSVELANAVTAASFVGTERDKVDTTSSATTIAYDDMIETRNLILSALDSEMLKTEDDDVYRALEESRSAVYQDITTRAENRARLVEYMPTDILPALVIASDYYGDASREAEIIERNGIAHGGFVPMRPLKLLNA